MDSVPHDHDAVVDAFLIAGSKSENTTIDASSAHVMTELPLIRQGHKELIFCYHIQLCMVTPHFVTSILVHGIYML